MAIVKGKKIFTLDAWCRSNGYGGVTEDCILSAQGSGKDKIRALAKKERIKNISKKGD